MTTILQQGTIDSPQGISCTKNRPLTYGELEVGDEFNAYHGSSWKKVRVSRRLLSEGDRVRFEICPTTKTVNPSDYKRVEFVASRPLPPLEETRRGR